MKKIFVAAVLGLLAAGLTSMPCRAQEILPTVPSCGLWALDPAQINTLGEFERATMTFVSDGAVVWLEDHAVTASDSLPRDALSQIRIFSASPRPSVGISPLYINTEQATRGRLKIRCINPMF